MDEADDLRHQVTELKQDSTLRWAKWLFLVLALLGIGVIAASAIIGEFRVFPIGGVVAVFAIVGLIITRRVKVLRWLPWIG